MQIKFVDMVIETENLSYKDILTNVSVGIKRGEYAAVIGQTAAAKVHL